MRQFRGLFIGIVVVCVVVFLSRGLLGFGSTRSADKADFAFINRGDVSTLDVSRASWMQDLRAIAMLFEPLVRNDVFDKDFAKVPGVAERWELAPDGMTWTFTLRANAKWSNGQPVTAGDFVFAFRRAMLPDTAGDYIKLFGLIEGAKEFTQWRTDALEAFRNATPGVSRPVEAEALWTQTLAKFDEMVSLKAPNDRTLVMKLRRPVPYWLDICAFEVFVPLYPPLVMAHESIDPVTGMVRSRSDWTRPPKLISNGPFQLDVWKFKREMRFSQNPHYWDKDSLSVRSIYIPSVEDKNAQVLAFRTGSVQWVSDISADYRGEMILAKQDYLAQHQAIVEKLQREGLDQIEIDRRLPPDERLNIHSIPAFGTYFFNFNCQPKLNDGRDNPFADPRVRRAFAMSFDKENIAKNIRRSGEPVARTLTPPNSVPGYTVPAGLGFDPPAARKLLAEAGYPDGKGFITVEILFNRDAGHDVISQAIKKDWEQHLGVKVVLAQKEIKVFRQDLKSKNFMISRAGWFGDYGDPLTFLDLSRTGDGNNDRGFSYKPFDDLLEAADNERDLKKRMEILSQAETMLMEEQMPMVPIFHYCQVYLFDPHKLGGISPHSRQKQYMFLADVLGDGLGKEQAPVLRRK